MNEFTKEELEALIETFDQAERECSEDWMPNLKRKILSLIESYCDHKCDHVFKRRELKIYLCDKCHNFKFVFAGNNE